MAEFKNKVCRPKEDDDNKANMIHELASSKDLDSKDVSVNKNEEDLKKDLIIEDPKPLFIKSEQYNINNKKSEQ